MNSAKFSNRTHPVYRGIGLNVFTEGCIKIGYARKEVAGTLVVIVFLLPVRIDPPFDLQVVHADRSGNVQEPIDLHNPVLDSLIAVGGEPGAVALFDDEDFVGPLLEVVHRHPASSVDDEGVTLRAEGLGELAAALGRALELASALRRLQ